jgi:dTDP-4-dehydrorhamnose 3,5-epimerase
MEVSKTSLDGVLLITPPTIFKDFRGGYIETYNKNLYHDAGIVVDFVQDDISISSRHVLRGIFYLVTVNWDEASQQFGKWETFELSEENHLQVLIPPKFGNGHLVLSDQAIFHYKQSTYYNRVGQFTLMWDDPRLNIPWPVKNPILSKRDQGEINA